MLQLAIAAVALVLLAPVAWAKDAALCPAAIYQQRVMAAWPSGSRFGRLQRPALPVPGIYTQEFASELAREAALKAARNVGLGGGTRIFSQTQGPAYRGPRQHTPDFDRELAQEAALRAARNRAMGLRPAWSQPYPALARNDVGRASTWRMAATKLDAR